MPYTVLECFFVVVMKNEFAREAEPFGLISRLCLDEYHAGCWVLTLKTSIDYILAATHFQHTAQIFLENSINQLKGSNSHSGHFFCYNLKKNKELFVFSKDIFKKEVGGGKLASVQNCLFFFFL